MSKAEEKTTELMKKAKDFIPDGGYSEKELNLAFFMFIKGYHQAEKDLEHFENFVNSLQEEPTPPGIQEESQKKGWLDYGLMMGEIGLHRYNAIHRIKEHKKQFNPLAIPDLYHVAEYYESVGMEKVCCCLQAYSKDFLFTQDEVKKIIEKEG